MKKEIIIFPGGTISMKKDKIANEFKHRRK